MPSFFKFTKRKDDNEYMLVFNNTVKSPLKNIEIKGNTTPCGFDNGDGTFKITILTTNGLEKSDSKYEEISQDIIIPCKLGSVNEKQDIIKFDKTLNKLILEQKTENGKLLEKPKIHELNFTLNVIGFDGKTTIKVSDGAVEALVKATASKTLFSGQHAIADTLREVMSAVSSNFNYINKVKAALDSHRHKNVTTTSDGFMSKEDKEKLNGVQTNANNYVHPNDINTRHVSDTQIASWDEKPTNMDVDKKIKKVVGSAPEALDTLKEISDALNNDADFAGTMTKQLSNKSDKGHNHDDRYVSRAPKRIKNEDLNGIVQGGNYVVESCTNSPNGYGRLVVLQWDTSAKWITQVFYADSKNEVFTRCSLDSQGNTWCEWRKLSTNADNDLRYFRKDFENVIDFNNCKTEGIHNVNGANIPNAPFNPNTTLYGKLIVYVRDSDITQMFISHENRIFLRFCNNGSIWSNWTKVFSTFDTPSWNDIKNKPDLYTKIEVNDNFVKTKVGYVTDFNIAKEPGIWNISGTDIPNSPFSGTIYGTMEVIDRNGDKIQRVTTSSGAIFIRYYAGGGSNSGFREWNKVYTSTTAPKWSEIREKPSTLEGLSVGDENIKLIPNRNNEISFGGSFRGNSSIFFGYRDIEGRPVPTEYIFGKAGDGANIRAKDFFAMGNKVYHAGNKPTWNDIENKPSTFTPSTHNHDDRYLNKSNGYVSDFNKCLTEGIYSVGSDTPLPNSPVADGIYGILEVFKKKNEYLQRCTNLNGQTYVRYLNYKNEWLPWRKIMTTLDFETGTVEGKSYMKLPNNVLIQWGHVFVTISEGFNNASAFVYFPVSFTSDYICTGNVASNDFGGYGEVNASVIQENPTRAYTQVFTLNGTNPGGGKKVRVNWMAIGRY